MPQFAINGIHLVSWKRGEYSSDEGAAAIDALADTGATWAGVLTTWYQANAAATVMLPDAERSPSDDDMRSAVERLHARGVKVMLKPHVDALDGSWRGTFRPRNADEWFGNYGRMLAHYAELAESWGVEGLAIGTEFVQMTEASFRRRWAELASDVRSRFGGWLTYAANAAHKGDEFSKIPFWDEMDLIGLDAYFPVNEGWQMYVSQIRRLAEQFDRPVVFTEIGYRSIRSAAAEPWNYLSKGEADASAQAACYRSFFEHWTPHANWMQGAFWWNWPARQMDPSNNDYTPRDKPAGAVLAQAFGESPDAARARRLEQIRQKVQSGTYAIDAAELGRTIVRKHLRSEGQGN